MFKVMELEEFCKRLDEARLEINQLKAEYQIKTKLYDSVNKAHIEQLLKFDEAGQQTEKQARELDAKSEQFSELRHMVKALKSSLHEKDLSLSHLSSTNKKVLSDCRAKLCKLEVENRKLFSALGETIKKEKRFVYAEQKVQAPKKMRQGDEVILRLEEDNRDIQEQLKWKSEQFQHLEEAHRRIQEQLRSREEEWEREKSTMLQEISSLQTRLDSQTRISDSLQNQLEMCNQALAHQESMGNFLENQVSEFKLHCKNEGHEEKSRMEWWTIQRDEEIAGLRNLLVNKEALLKELEFIVSLLGQENKELAASLKELQKSQIRNAGTASLLTELCHKLKGLEQVHCNCCTNFQARESEWSSQMEKMKDYVTSSKSELQGKKKQIEKLHKELENLHFTVDVLNEELSILLMVLKLEFSEAFCKLFNARAEVEQCIKGKEDKISFLTEQLEMKNDALNRSQHDLEQEHKKVTALLKRVESLDSKDQQLILVIEELEMHKKMLQELSDCQFHLKEQVLQMENMIKRDRKEIYDTLEKAEFELGEIIREGHQLEDEWLTRNSTVEGLKVYVGENKVMCKQREKSLKLEKECLIRIVKDQDKSTGNPKVSQEPTITETKIVEALIEEKENLLHLSEEKDSSIDTLHAEISWLMEDSIRKETEVEICAKLDAEKAFQKEQERLLKILNEKGRSSIGDLQVLVMLIEEDLTNVVASYLSEITGMQVEINAINKDLKNDEYWRKLLVEEHNNIIAGFEKEVSGLCQQLSSLEESFLHVKQVAEQLQTVVEAKTAETEKWMNQFQNEKRSMKALVEEFQIDKGVLLQDMMKLSSERENILVIFEEFYAHLSEISVEDAKLMKILERKLQSCGEETGPLIDSKVLDELHDSDGRKCNYSFSLSITRPEKNAYERSALKELNI